MQSKKGRVFAPVELPALLERVDTFQVELYEVDFSRAEIGAFADVGHLRGAVLSSKQLIDVAPATAAHLGVTLNDDQEALR